MWAEPTSSKQGWSVYFHVDERYGQLQWWRGWSQKSHGVGPRSQAAQPKWERGLTWDSSSMQLWGDLLQHSSPMVGAQGFHALHSTPVAQAQGTPVLHNIWAWALQHHIASPQRRHWAFQYHTSSGRGHSALRHRAASGCGHTFASCHGSTCCWGPTTPLHFAMCWGPATWVNCIIWFIVTCQFVHPLRPHCVGAGVESSSLGKGAGAGGTFRVAQLCGVAISSGCLLCGLGRVPSPPAISSSIQS